MCHQYLASAPCEFQELLAQERDYVSACELLRSGADYAGVKRAEYTKILFMLSRGMVSHPVISSN